MTSVRATSRSIRSPRTSSRDEARSVRAYAVLDLCVYLCDTAMPFVRATFARDLLARLEQLHHLIALNRRLGRALEPLLRGDRGVLGALLRGGRHHVLHVRLRRGPLVLVLREGRCHARISFDTGPPAATRNHTNSARRAPNTTQRATRDVEHDTARDARRSRHSAPITTPRAEHDTARDAHTSRAFGSGKKRSRSRYTMQTTSARKTANRWSRKTPSMSMKASALLSLSMASAEGQTALCVIFASLSSARSAGIVPSICSSMRWYANESVSTLVQ